MGTLKTVLACISGALLLTGAGAWLTGKISAKSNLTRLGLVVLSAWLVFDFLCIILAYSLGLFAT